LTLSDKKKWGENAHPTEYLDVNSTAVMEIIQPPLQIRFIGNIYRLSAVCIEQITQKELKLKIPR